MKKEKRRRFKKKGENKIFEERMIDKKRDDYKEEEG